MISDVVIVGAGPVGCALAMYMKKVANNVRLVDGACITKPQQDKRKLAISYGSQIILGRLGIWQNLESSPRLAPRTFWTAPSKKREPRNTCPGVCSILQ